MRWVIPSTLMICSCAALKRDASKFSFTDGWYQSKDSSGKKAVVYVTNTADTVWVYAPQPGTRNLNPAQPLLRMFPVSNTTQPAYRFAQPSFDVDFLTIPFKFRPAQPQFPRQFTTNLNGAVYLGYRYDVYQLHYRPTPLSTFKLRKRHFGFSGGAFTGLGATVMNPWVTGGAIDIEYDGVAWSKGIAGIIAIDRFTLGLALGWDHLLDQNRKAWFYQNKPWLGLAFGLNLN